MNNIGYQRDERSRMFFYALASQDTGVLAVSELPLKQGNSVTKPAACHGKPKLVIGKLCILLQICAVRLLMKN